MSMLARSLVCRMRPPQAPLQRLQLLSRHFMASEPRGSAEPPRSPPLHEPHVLVESDKALRRYIINRPSQLNALSLEAIALLRHNVLKWNTAHLCQVIVGTGVGRAFCAGGDVKKVVELAAQPSTSDQACQFFKQEFELNYILACLDKPYVVIMDGFTLGGGAGLSYPANFRVATDKTRFGMPETNIGYFPDVGASYYLSRLDGELGTYLALTGTQLNGRDMFELGLATHYIPSSRVPILLENLAALERLDSGERLIDTSQDEATPDDLIRAGMAGSLESPSVAESTAGTSVPAFVIDSLALDMINSTIEELYLEREAHEPPLALSGPVRTALDRAFRHNEVEQIIADLRGHASSSNSSVSKWAKDTLEILELRSPTSLKIALMAIRYGPKMDLLECLQMEYNLAHAACTGLFPDFATGVNHVLGTRPAGTPVPGRAAWSPSTIPEVLFDELQEKIFDPERLENLSILDVPDGLSEGEWLTFALPTEEQIGFIVRGDHETSGDTALTFDEIVDKCTTIWTKHGVRERVQEILSRRCIVDKSTPTHTLKWVHRDRE